ncbi:MAG: glycoside hydrolase [Sedimentisphaerales bacterium]
MTLSSRNKDGFFAAPFKGMFFLLAGLLLCSWTSISSVESSQAAPKKLTISNDMISVMLDSNDATLSVTDNRTGNTWRQKSLTEGKIIQTAGTKYGIEITWRQDGLDMAIKTELLLDKDLPEFTLTLTSEGEFKQPLRFPHPFITEPGTYLVVPMNEGISYPIEDKTISPIRLVAYGGHGICMPFWGVTDGRQGHMAIIETPDDAAIRIQRIDEKLCIAPEWDSQKGHFGYARRLRYIFFDKGGHVAVCKRYRSYAQKTGLLKTLEQKRKENPDVDLLVGAVNVWCWEKDALDIVREMKSLGIERILWSHREQPDVIKSMNEMDGVLTSRYDIYQDLMDPQVVEQQLRRVHPDWTQNAWPKDIMLDKNGDWQKGWQVKGKDGNMYPCGVLCDRQAPKYAQQRVLAELKTHPYKCRFIDTTTASPWRECYHPDHPMTRSDSRHWKMELLRVICEDMKLVTGSETGHDAAVPYVHYFEGMLSLGPYRVPDAGRNMREIWTEVPERVAKFQVGHKYRLPLWELVYHDCVVAQWYWGDYNNKLPALWDKRDLFNILYGTPPMFMFNRQVFNQNKERFAQSYKDVCPVARAVGYAEMTDHRFLTSDRNVQKTSFANGTTITVNFGDEPYRMPNGKTVVPMSYHVSGM